MKLSITDRGIHSIGELLGAGGYQARLMGGAVRDMVLGIEPKDMDLATDALPETVMDLAEGVGYRVIPTGLQHGTVTIMHDDVGYEVTTLRRDVETDGRHATVEYVTSFEVDASRRDFTFNAMSASLDGQVHDYFGGLKDLSEGRVRFVGNARERIEEDYLRILRFFRFRARFGGQEASEDLEAIHQTAGGLAGISVERVWSEMSKILAHPNAADQLRMMSELDISSVIGLRYDEEMVPVAIDVQLHGARPAVVLGVLSGDEGHVKDLVERWKLSNAEQQDAIAAARVVSTNRYDDHYWMTEVVNGLDKTVAIPVLLAFRASEAALAISGQIPTFPLMGRDLVGLVEKGPAMGAALKDARQRWIDSKFKLTKDDLLENLSGKLTRGREL